MRQLRLIQNLGSHELGNKQLQTHIAQNLKTLKKSDNEI